MLVDLRPVIVSAYERLSELHGATLYGWSVYNITMLLVAIVSYGSLWNFSLAERVEYLLHNDVRKLSKKQQLSECDLKKLAHDKKNYSLHLKGCARGYAALALTLGAFSLWVKPKDLVLSNDEKATLECLVSRPNHVRFNLCRKRALSINE